MLIPKQVTVGKTTYTVYAPRTIDRALVHGNVHYGTQTILVAKRSRETGKPLSAARRTHVFWHEITHAILRDMDHRLESNEVFVDAFSKRIADVVRTAKF